MSVRWKCYVKLDVVNADSTFNQHNAYLIIAGVLSNCALHGNNTLARPTSSTTTSRSHDFQAWREKKMRMGREMYVIRDDNKQYNKCDMINRFSNVSVIKDKVARTGPGLLHSILVSNGIRNT